MGQSTQMPLSACAGRERLTGAMSWPSCELRLTVTASKSRVAELPNRMARIFGRGAWSRCRAYDILISAGSENKGKPVVKSNAGTLT